MARGRKRAADAALDVDGAAEIAKSFKSKRTNASTKRAYSSKISVMVQWVRTKYAQVLDAQDQLQLPLPKEAVLGFFGHLSEPAHECDVNSIHADDTASPPLSVSCVTGYRSALVDLYRTHEVELDSALNDELKSVLEGYEKTINGLKQRGLMDINEGKRHLKSNGYDLLAQKLFKQIPGAKGQSWSTLVFAWTYFVLMWNLMSRSDSVDKIMLEHIDWGEDAMIIEEQGHKGDQTGADKFGKHVYANPYEPAKCPILALAVLLFSFPDRLDGRHQLFVGTDNKGRFGRALRNVIKSLSDDELQQLGCNPNDIGTHSLRKGSSTYALGQVSGPNPVTVYLRMGQSLGRLKDRYIHFGEGADQLCGRMIAGLPFDSEQFAALPPHFSPEMGHELTNAFWQGTVSGFDRYPRSAKTIFPYLLASLVHHESFLRQNLSPNHPIFTARVFASNSLLGCLRTSCVIAIGTSPVCALKATGIPPHLAIATKVNSVAKEVVDMKNEMKALPSLIASTVVNELRQSFAIEGAVPVTLQDIDSRMCTLRDDIMGEIQKARASRPAPITTTDLDSSSSLLWKTWDWEDGRICHFVPLGWEFPVRLRVKAVWDLWQYGDRNSGIRLYRQISKQHDIIPKHSMRHHRAKTVMDELEALAVEHFNVDVRRLHEQPIQRSDELLTSSYAALLQRLYPASAPHRPEEITCGTLFNRLCAIRKSGQ